MFVGQQNKYLSIDTPCLIDLPQEPAVLNAKKSKAGVTPRPDKSKDGDRKKEKVVNIYVSGV